MTHLRRNYEKADLWTNLKVNNVFPVITFILGLATTVLVFQAKVDRTVDRVADLERVFGDYRNIEYQNAIEISGLKVRLGIRSEVGEVKGVATSSAQLTISPKK